jgi:hypothetical protein
MAKIRILLQWICPQRGKPVVIKSTRVNGFGWRLAAKVGWLETGVWCLWSLWSGKVTLEMASDLKFLAAAAERHAPWTGAVLADGLEGLGEVLEIVGRFKEFKTKKNVIFQTRLQVIYLMARGLFIFTSNGRLVHGEGVKVATSITPSKHCHWIGDDAVR